MLLIWVILGLGLIFENLNMIMLNKF